MKAAVSYGNSRPEVIRIPSSKSLTHRALIAAALAEGESVIHSPAFNRDTEATIEALRKLNVSMHAGDDAVTVSGKADLSAYDGSVIDCHESGSTLRFLIPLFASSGKPCRFTGQGKLMERPLSVYEEIYGSSGVFVLKDRVLTVQGRSDGTEYRLKGNVSSQFVSGLLFVLPLQDHDSRIELLEPVESLSYIDMTIDVLRMAQIDVCRKENTIFIRGNQRYQPFSCRIAGDDSQAAFFIMQALMADRTVRIAGIDPDSRQGDHVIVRVAENCGAEISWEEDIMTIRPKGLRPLNADLKDCPDLGPVLFAAAACCPQTSRFTGVARLRLKESDRISSMKAELEKTGCLFEETENEVRIVGNSDLPGGYCFDGHNDHRIVMALAVLASCLKEPSLIEGADAVGKSYPDFFEDLKKTGAEVKLYD